jgi:hypothetical protein
MFELSHRLIGIYKTSNATRSEPVVQMKEHIVTVLIGITIDNHDLDKAPAVST